MILDSLDDLMEGRTSFIVAHRLSTVRHADQILVLDKGRVVESGTHEELLRVGNVYRQLHEAQNRERKRRRPAVNGGNGGTPAEAPAEEAVIWRQVTEGG